MPSPRHQLEDVQSRQLLNPLIDGTDMAATMTRPTVNPPHMLSPHPQHYQSRPDRSPSFSKASRPQPYPQRGSEIGSSSIDRHPDDRYQDQRERTTSGHYDQPRLPMQRTASETSYRSNVQLPPLHTISQSAFYPPPMPPPPRTFTPSRPSPPRTAHDSSAYYPYASSSRDLDGGSPRVRVKEEPTDHVYRPTLPRPDGERSWHYDQYQDHRRVHDAHDHRTDRRRAHTDVQYVGAPRHRSPPRSHYPEYAGPPSPPLRPLHPDGQRQSYLPPSHPYPYSEYQQAGPSSGKRAPRSEPERTSLAPAAKNEDVPSGQNRRLAHLMSEQKRRESINSGFASLRKAVPAAVPSDSKAIVLRKAVTYIHRLGATLREANVPFNRDEAVYNYITRSPSGILAGGDDGGTGPLMTPASYYDGNNNGGDEENDELDSDRSGGDANMEEDEDGSRDAFRRERTRERESWSRGQDRK